MEWGKHFRVQSRLDKIRTEYIWIPYPWRASVSAVQFCDEKWSLALPEEDRWPTRQADSLRDAGQYQTLGIGYASLDPFK